MLAHVAGLSGEDDRRVSLAREDHVRVAVHDLESRHVRHGAFEPGVLGATDDEGVQVLRLHRLADEAVATLDFLRAHHDRSNPFTSAQIARFSGVGTRCSSPNRAMPPFR